MADHLLMIPAVSPISINLLYRSADPAGLSLPLPRWNGPNALNLGEITRFLGNPINFRLFYIYSSIVKIIVSNNWFRASRTLMDALVEIPLGLSLG